MNISLTSFQFPDITFSEAQPVTKTEQNPSNEANQEVVGNGTSSFKLTTKGLRMRKSCNKCREAHIKCTGLAGQQQGPAKKDCSNCSAHGYECKFIQIRRPGPKMGTHHAKSPASDNSITLPRKSQKRNQTEISEAPNFASSNPLPTENTDTGAAAAASQAGVSLLSTPVLETSLEPYSFEGYDALLAETMPWLNKIFQIEASSSVFQTE